MIQIFISFLNLHKYQGQYLSEVLDCLLRQWDTGCVSRFHREILQEDDTFHYLRLFSPSTYGHKSLQRGSLCNTANSPIIDLEVIESRRLNCSRIKSWYSFEVDIILTDIIIKWEYCYSTVTAVPEAVTINILPFAPKTS